METNRPTKHNKLNELTGTQWLKFQKSWFIHNSPPRSEQELLHNDMSSDRPEITDELHGKPGEFLAQASTADN